MSKDHPWPPDVVGLLPEGTILKGEYRVTGYLGAGAFGAVYTAEQQTIKRRVAIKLLQEGQDATARERFLLEAQAAASIDHPNVVNIYDYGVYNESQPFIVMEYLRGRDLYEELRDHGPLSPARALPLFIACLDALGEAHEKGIIHKDLKPSNLFLVHPGTHRETLKILDFGIARVNIPAEGDDATNVDIKSGAITTAGQSIGTPQYLAPEYVEKQTVTPALDVYQMGLIIAESLTGVIAVEGNSWWSCALKHIRGELTFSDVLLESPMGVVILTATNKDALARYQDAHAFRDALMAVPDPERPAPSTLVEPPRTEVEHSERVPTQREPQLQVVPPPPNTGQSPGEGAMGKWAVIGGVTGAGAIILIIVFVVFMALFIPMCTVCVNNNNTNKGTTTNPGSNRFSNTSGEATEIIIGTWNIVAVKNPPPNASEETLKTVQLTISEGGIEYKGPGGSRQTFHSIVNSDKKSVTIRHADTSTSTFRIINKNRMKVTDNTPVGTVMTLVRD